ncbi:DUF1573 domain-containing protein [soil metagenome]
MKKIYSLLVLMIFTAGIMSAQVKTTTSPVLAKGPVITFESLVLDYGTIAHNADGHREFKFTNTGSEDLIISGCTGSCGCTVPECPREVYGPGESGVVKVKYATDRVGQFTKNVTVNSNATNGTITLTIKGNVLPD